MKKATKLAYLHWHAGEAETRAEALREAGHAVEVFSSSGGDAMRKLRGTDFDAVLIDLARLPSHGRAVAFALRASPATRSRVLVFFAADAEKTQRLQAELPDAAFTTWQHWKRDLRGALQAPPREPIVPRSMSGYSGTPLWKKLGAQPDQKILLLNAPADFDMQADSLPSGADVQRRLSGSYRLALCFFRSAADMQKRWPKLQELLLPGGSLWIAWPKLAGGLSSDLSSQRVRTYGLSQGLVDTKVCAVDATWSALRFQMRKARRNK